VTRDGFLIPGNLLDASRREGREGWLAGLPALVTRLTEQWSLEVGPPFEPGGQTAWVAPARRAGRETLVLKVGWRHLEAEHEAAGLHAWDGVGAVRLHAETTSIDSFALLLERCVPGSPLSSRPEPEQDLVLADLLSRLWVEPPLGHSFRPLAVMCGAWADEFEERAPGRSILDAGLARQGVALFRSLPRTAERSVLLCTDLHAENVLAAERMPWLVIDPKPYVGDPTYDVLQHLLNCDARLRADPRGAARRMADLLDLDRDRLERWLFARCVVESVDWPALASVARRLAPA
jgi:streptomycin 6-kinase